MGSGIRRCAQYVETLRAPSAVEWFADASPKLHTTTLSLGHTDSTLLRVGLSRASARPNARGRCDAIVDVCGITARGTLPNTLWRPPEIASVVDDIAPLRMSSAAEMPATWLARAE